MVVEEKKENNHMKVPCCRNGHSHSRLSTAPPGVQKVGGDDFRSKTGVTNL